MKYKLSLMKTIFNYLFAGLFTCLSFSGFSQTVVINEIVSSNGDVNTDEDGDFEDWIELYNYGSQPINLKGFFISDNASEPLMWEFPDVNIPSKGFLLIWASGKDRKTFPLHTNFRINQSGEPILLSDNSGKLLDKIDARFIERDYSLGRNTDGGNQLIIFETPTPGKSNTTHTGKVITESVVSFSHEPGFYNSLINLSLSISDPSYKIYYTTDGSEPSDASKLYTGAITLKDRSNEPNGISSFRNTTIDGTTPPSQRVRKANIIRAKGINTQGHQTRVFSGTFFIDEAQKMNYTVPVISIKLKEGDLFDYHTGIYVPGKVFDNWKAQNPGRNGDGGSPANYRMRGKEWEKEAHIEFFDNRQLVLAEDIGLRMHGGWSRANPIKPLRIYLPQPTHQNLFKRETAFFKDGNPIHRFVLRPSGNDFYSTLFRDAMMQSLAEEAGLTTQNFRPSIVFLNGEYWGIHNIRERIDKYYLASNFGVNEDKVDLLSFNGEVDEGSSDHYWNMINFIRNNDLSLKENYDLLNTMMDIDQFMRYFAMQIYYNNQDWPHNNIKYWRKKTASYEPDARYGHDGRWRWILFDTDFGFDLYTSFGGYHHNTLEWASRRNTHFGEWPNLIFHHLLKNEGFRINLINFFADCLNSNLKPQNVVNRIQQFRSLYSPEIQEHRARWEFPWNWSGEISRLTQFANYRPGHLKSHIRNQFNLPGLSKITLQSSIENQGFEINTLSLKNIKEWSGDYFQNIPVKIKAIPKPGYRFVRWEGTDITDPQIELLVTSDTTFKALYEDLISWPEPFAVKDTIYHFSAWSADSEANTYPAHMTFLQTSQSDPDLYTEFDSHWVLPYNYSSRSRIKGLHHEGIAFINTGNPQDTTVAGYLGAAMLALNTEGVMDGLVVNFTAGTVTPNSRTYGLRLQYKTKREDNFKDVMLKDKPVEYLRNEEAGHQQQFLNIPLPEDAHNRQEVYLRWKYYYVDTGVSGTRAELRLDNIKVFRHITPAVHDLFCNDYTFTEWPHDAVQGSYPQNMVFYQITDVLDPKLEDEVDLPYTLSYNREMRSRINGLGSDGISFINTSNPQEDPGSGFLGAALVAVNTKGLNRIQVDFTAGTITSNDREYRLALQYRIGNSGAFKDIHDKNGNKIEYVRNSSGHEQVFGGILLPAEASGQEEVQVRWKYYHVETGVSGPRAEIRLDNITISGQPEITLTENDQLCYGMPLNESLKIAEGNTVEWYFNGTAISGNNPAATQSGNYKAMVTNTGSCTKETPVVNIQVNEIPKPTIEVTRRTNDYLLVSSSTTGNQWFKNGAVLPGENGQVLAVNTPGDYAVKVTQNGCNSAMSEVALVTSVEEYHTNELNIYPNPFGNSITIKKSGDAFTDLKITIIDVRGKTLFHAQIDRGNDFQINTSAFPKGFYVMQISEGIKTTSRKLVKVY